MKYAISVLALQRTRRIPHQPPSGLVPSCVLCATVLYGFICIRAHQPTQKHLATDALAATSTAGDAVAA